MTYYPEVERLVLDLEFSNQQGQHVRDDKFTYGPNDPVNFLAACAGQCGDGQTNLQSKIESMVRNRQTTGEGRAQCANLVFMTGQPCGYQLKCQIQVAYRQDSFVEPKTNS